MLDGLTKQMKAARIVIEASVASFRQPFFLVGRQITYEMPPPSTIYGHVASALGELPGRDAFRFAYYFEFAQRTGDLEYQWIITPGSKGKTNATMQPHTRDFLFKPRLTLYLDRPELADAFREPVFCVQLGRSQDLAEIRSIEVIDLDMAPNAYFENTLLPFNYRYRTGRGVTMLMPQFIEAPPERRAHFARYIVLREKIFVGAVDGEPSKSRIVAASDTSETIWIDRQSPIIHGVHRGVIFHDFGRSD